MIKYGVMAQYKCANCLDIIDVPVAEEMDGLSKYSGVDTCMHDWHLIEEKETATE